MELLLVLVTLHLVGDFYLQPDSWVSERNKNKIYSLSLLKHVAVHFILNLVVLSFLKYPALDILFVVSLIAISHYITDLWKSYQAQTNFYFVIDQLIHFLVLILCWFYLYDNAFDLVKKVTQQTLKHNSILIVVCYLLACKPASVLMSLGLKAYAKQLDENQHGLATAGKWIGYLERCLIITFIIINQFAAIGFLLAAKTIFRFGDLSRNKDMKMTEYVMIGTLFSFSIAILLGLLAK